MMRKYKNESAKTLLITRRKKGKKKNMHKNH